MSATIVKIDTSMAAPPDAVIQFKGLQLCNYECDLCNSTSTITELQEGDNRQGQNEDSFSIQHSPTQMVNGKEYLRWTLIVQKLSSTDQAADIVIVIRQAGQTLTPPIPITDKFPSGSNTLTALVFVDFEAK